MKIWESTPNSLIDFEADRHRRLSTTISTKGILYQFGPFLKSFSSKEEANKSIPNQKLKEKFLCKVTLKQDSYEVEMNEENSNVINEEDNISFNNIDIDNVPWIISKYVFENNREHGYKLHKGDMFKLGKYILKVKELGIDEEDKRIIIERKNTQKIIKKKKISSNNISNISQIPLNNNQQEEDFAQILNLNSNINHKNNEIDNAINNNNINMNQHAKNNSNSISDSEKESYEGNNIHIIEHENEDSKNNESSNSNNSNGFSMK